MAEKLVVVVGDIASKRHPSSYYRPFSHLAEQGDTELAFTDPDKVLCLVFTGGEDVDPVMYGIKKNPKTGCCLRRDKDEKRYFDQAVRHKIPMAGICRGSQFLCAMNGGILAQHVMNHACGGHTIRTLHHGIVAVTSTHHQMQIPPKDAIVLAWAEPKRSSRYEGQPGEELHPEVEYEGVYYPKTRSLAMQWHPEWMDEDSDGLKYTIDLINKWINAKL